MVCSSNLYWNPGLGLLEMSAVNTRYQKCDYHKNIYIFLIYTECTCIIVVINIITDKL